MAAPREEDLLEAVNILRPFAMPLRTLSDTTLPVLHVAAANVESATTKKLDSKNIYEISFERAEYGKVIKSAP